MSSFSQSLASKVSDKSFYWFTAILSTVALSFLAYLLWFRKGSVEGWDVSFLPAVNASFNALSATLLFVGWIAIRKKAIRFHRYCMVSAFASSTLFLVCYIIYHYAHGDTKYQGVGILRTIYLSVLASHIILSMFVVPLALLAFYFAFKGSFKRHKKITRYALPIWLYVSVTGVIIFFMLRNSTAAY